jgi:hypothetical protein
MATSTDFVEGEKHIEGLTEAKSRASSTSSEAATIRALSQ